MNEVFFIGLFWGIMGVLLIQAATVMLLRYVRRQDARARSNGELDAEGRLSLLHAKNERQGDLIDRMQQRLAVLERITTDPADRTAREIDALR